MPNYYQTTKYYNQPTADELIKKRRETLSKAKKKGKLYQPVIVTTKKITTTWWGNAWCENLEQYADYESRLPRGKRYVKTGSVIDLQIEKGKIHARVQGTRKTPYKVEIKISPLSEQKCQYIIDQCASKLDDIDQLIHGTFPQDMKNLFQSADGLFPNPKEINLNCSCPDWAIMCKHVAAALYGVGVRLDTDPLIMFELRGIDIQHFIDVALQNRVETMLQNENKPSPRIIDDARINDVFGFDYPSADDSSIVENL